MADLRKVIEVNPSDYNCVAPGRHMKGNVVDAYLRILERRSMCSDALPLVFAFNHVFFNFWDDEGIQENIQEHDIFAKDLLLFPSLINNHWTLILVDIRKRQINCFDPLGKPHYSLMEKVLDFLFEEAKAKKVTFSREAWTCVRQSENCPKRDNEADSGVYVCVFSEKLTRDRSLFRRCIDVLAACKAVSQAIRRHKIDLEDFSPHEPLLFERFGIVYPKFSLEGMTLQQAKPKFVFKENYLKNHSRRLVPEFKAQPRIQSSSPELPEDANHFIHSICDSDSLESNDESSVQQGNPKKSEDLEVPVSIIKGLPSGSTAVKRKRGEKQQIFGMDKREKRKKGIRVASRNIKNSEILEASPVCQTLKAQISIVPQGRSIVSETPSGSVNNRSLIKIIRFTEESGFIVCDPQ